MVDVYSIHSTLIEASMKRILYAVAVVAISTAAFAPLQASAQINVNIIVPSAPPPIIVEVAPPPRSGYIWASGYWNWNGGKHVWSEGRWERVRVDHHYERPEWHRDGDNWRFQEGGWKTAKKDKKHNKHDNGNFCSPGQAKKGNC
jgi:hypothetical protein